MPTEVERDNRVAAIEASAGGEMDNALPEGPPPPQVNPQDR
jgi:hypothetical protein